MTVIAYTSAAPSPKVSQVDATVGQASLPQNIQLYGAGDDTADPMATFTYLWSIISAPPGSTASLSSSTAQNPTLNGVNVWGNYILMLVATSSTSGASESNPLMAPDTARVGVRVTSASAGLEKTARGERNWFVPGYWPVVDKVEQLDQIVSTLAVSAQPNGTLLVQAAANLAAGDVVYPSDVGLLGAVPVLVVSKAPATDSLVLTSQLFLMEEAVLSGATGVARWFGLTAILGVGSPSVLDPVYVSDTATLALSAGTNSRVLGQVVEVSGGQYQTVVTSAMSPGGASSSAPFLLNGPDASLPGATDITALTAAVEFIDTVGTIMPGSFGAPAVQLFDKGGAGSPGEMVAMGVGGMRNSANAFAIAAGLVARWLSVTAGAEEGEVVLMPTQAGSPVEAATVRPNRIFIPDTSGSVLPALVESDTQIRLKSTASSANLEGTTAAAVIVNSLYGLFFNSTADALSPTNINGTFEPRVLRRRALTTADATPTTIDYLDILTSGTFLVIAETNIAAADAGFAMYLTAKRVVRYSYDSGTATWVLLGSEYVPVPDDGLGPLAVTFTTNTSQLQVEVTGDASTTVEWTAWTQFLLTKIG